MADVSPTDLPGDPVPPTTTRTKRFWWVVGGIVCVLLAGMWWAGQQSRPKFPPAPADYCRASNRYDAELDRQAAAQKIDAVEQLELVEAMVIAADRPGRRRVPADVRADLTTFVEAMRRAAAGPVRKDDPQVQAAVDRVNRYSSQACGVFERRGL